ncbi:P-loop NTPase family protein, partial [Staphylococcus epidermidis]
QLTDIETSLQSPQLVHSTFHQPPQHHLKLPQLLLDHPKPLLQIPQHLIILIHSITPFARAYNLLIPPTPPTFSAPLHPASLHKPKAFFGPPPNIQP